MRGKVTAWEQVQYHGHDCCSRCPQQNSSGGKRSRQGSRGERKEQQAGLATFCRYPAHPTHAALFLTLVLRVGLATDDGFSTGLAHHGDAPPREPLLAHDIVTGEDRLVDHYMLRWWWPASLIADLDCSAVSDSRPWGAFHVYPRDARDAASSIHRVPLLRVLNDLTRHRRPRLDY